MKWSWFPLNWPWLGLVNALDGRLTDSTSRSATNFLAMPPRRPSKDTPAKLASRMKRRWRIVLIRKTGQVLGTVEAGDAKAAEKSRRSSSRWTRCSADACWCRSWAEKRLMDETEEVKLRLTLLRFWNAAPT